MLLSSSRGGNCSIQVRRSQRFSAAAAAAAVSNLPLPFRVALLPVLAGLSLECVASCERGREMRRDLRSLCGASRGRRARGAARQQRRRRRGVAKRMPPCVCSSCCVRGGVRGRAAAGPAAAALCSRCVWTNEESRRGSAGAHLDRSHRYRVVAIGRRINIRTCSSRARDGARRGHRRCCPAASASTYGQHDQLCPGPRSTSNSTSHDPNLQN